MSTGSITSLGLGSGLDLQDIMDQLREAEEATITAKETEKTELQNKSDAYNTVNAKLFSIKSDVFNLSLESNFLSNSVSVSDEDVLSATVSDGLDASSNQVNVTSLAQRNSWASAAVSSSSQALFDSPESGIADPDTTAAVSGDETLTFYYGDTGDPQQIDISLSAGMTLSEIVDEINNSSQNTDGQGGQLVSASYVLGDSGDYYIRLSATDGGNSDDSRVSVSGFDWVVADTTIAIGQGSSTMYLSVAPGTTYAGMAELINASDDNPGVTAAIINNGDTDNPYQLILTSDDTGEDGRLTLTDFDVMTEATGADGASLNAEFSVNGIAYSRQSNTGISDVIDGVTLNLKTVGETTVGVEVSLDNVKDDILSMVEGINNLLVYLEGDGDTSAVDESAGEADSTPLDGESSARRISYDIQSLLTTVLDLPEGYTSLADIGLEIDSDGTVSIDESALDDAIAADPQGVASLFLGDEDLEIQGMADLFNEAITNMVSTSGIASTEIDDAELRIERIDEYIETETERLDKKYETMAAEFSRLDTYISEMNSQADTLEALISSLSDD
ncbi:MAG: flagellar filament capping protein FliD [Desulfobacter sp.]|nr:MAG: flagellar filament capping protein FliD [Desulfobacter sp.]